MIHNKEVWTPNNMMYIVFCEFYQGPNKNLEHKKKQKFSFPLFLGKRNMPRKNSETFVVFKAIVWKSMSPRNKEKENILSI